MEEVRIDKWLWAVRIFKTRSLAIDACKKKRIEVNGQPIKPSKMIKRGDKIAVRKPPITYTFRVLDLSQNRMGAKLVPNYAENITSAEQYELLEMQKISGFIDRAKGLGRPTKKDRREIDQFITDSSFFDFEMDWDDEELE